MPDQQMGSAASLPPAMNYTDFLRWIHEVVAYCEPDKRDWCQENNDRYHQLTKQLIEKGNSFFR